MEWLTDTAVGTLLGFLAGIGTGGGSLLMLWLTAVRDVAPERARDINLLFFIPGATVATLMRGRKNKTGGQKLLPAIIAGCVAAVFGSLSGKAMDTSLLKKLFGILLILAGIKELFYKEKKG